MLPRSTGWMPLGSPSSEIHFTVAAADADSDGWRADTCIGSIFLRRENGGAVRIPLIYGRNVWDWWNPRARYYEHRLALYRIRWAAASDESPIVAISLVSTLRRPAPLLVAAEASRP